MSRKRKAARHPPDEAAVFDAGWMAQRLGMPNGEFYLEWAAALGKPLCGCRMPSGEFCRNPVGAGPLFPDAFKARHRRYACGDHRRIIMGTTNDPAEDRRHRIAIPRGIQSAELTIEEMILKRVARELDGPPRELVKVKGGGYWLLGEDGRSYFDTIEELMGFLGVARRADADASAGGPA
jgi:hypothetical protein